MEWLFNDGSPFVLLPKSLAPHWNRDGLGDCERACDGLETIKALSVADEAALAVEPEGGQVAWMASETGGCILIWIYVPQEIPDAELCRRVQELPDDRFEPPASQPLPGNGYVLMTAADTYPDGEYGALQIELPGGEYQAAMCRDFTFPCEGQDAEFYVVKLERIAASDKKENEA